MEEVGDLFWKEQDAIEFDEALGCASFSQGDLVPAPIGGEARLSHRVSKGVGDYYLYLYVMTIR